MKINWALTALVLISLSPVVHGIWAVIGIATSVVGAIINAADKKWVVEVHNEGPHHAHLWCASKDDRIGDINGIWVGPGNKLAWSFGRRPSTQFWCTMDWNGQRVGWDVYVAKWKDAPNPTKWTIRSDGVFDQWRWRKWRHLNS